MGRQTQRLGSLSAPSRQFHAPFSVQDLALPEEEDLDSYSGLSLDATDTVLHFPRSPAVCKHWVPFFTSPFFLRQSRRSVVLCSVARSLAPDVRLRP